MTGLEFLDEIPFTDVYIHSVIQAPDGRRMSKSLGTGIDPLELIDSHGADALRFGLLAMSSSQDVRFSEAKVQQGRDLANKLWNASRLILLNAGDADAGAVGGDASRTAGSSPASSAPSSWSASGSTPTTSPTPRSSSTASSTPSSATGTSRSSSRGSTTAPTTIPRGRATCCTCSSARSRSPTR